MAKGNFRIGEKVTFPILEKTAIGTIASINYKNKTITVRSNKKFYELDMDNFV